MGTNEVAEVQMIASIMSRVALGVLVPRAVEDKRIIYANKN